MSRYYSHETIRDNAKDVTLENGVKHRCIDPDALLDIEPADVRENVKGRWIKEIKHYKDDEQEYDYYDIYCSACGGKPEKAWHLTNYCPNCGADMRGEA